MSNSGYGAIAAAGMVIIVVIVYSIVGGHILSSPQTATTDTSSSASGSASQPTVTSSSSVTQLSSGSVSSSSAYYRIEFTGKASADEGQSQGNSPGSLTSYTTNWNWDLVFYYTGNPLPGYPVTLQVYLPQSTISLTGLSTFGSGTTCMGNSTQVGGAGAFVVSFEVYPNGTAVAASDPWASVAAVTYANSSSFCAQNSVWGTTGGGTFDDGYYGQLKFSGYSFQLDPGIIGGLGGSLDITNPCTSPPAPGDCLVYPTTSYEDSWSGSITITSISCSGIPEDILPSSCYSA